MRVLVHFRSKEEEVLYYGKFVALLSFGADNVIRDRDGSPIDAETDDDLLEKLKLLDRNDWKCIVYIHYPERVMQRETLH